MPSPCLRRLCLVLLLVTLTVVPVVGANIAAGSIAVRSVPGGASVTLDGVYQGRTPLGNEALTIENIDPGPHQLVLSKSGYLDAQHPFWMRLGAAERHPHHALRDHEPGRLGLDRLLAHRRRRVCRRRIPWPDANHP